MKKGDIIKFGNYPQDSNGSISPIEWLVLDVKENESLLISRYGLDCRQYNREWVGITWEDSNLRTWLNNGFIKTAFSENEIKKIKDSELENKGQSEYKTRGGNDTRDRIFCLSIYEAKQYFNSDNDRLCLPTPYARNQGVYVNDNGYCYWWLRSPGNYQRSAVIVNSNGALDLHGDIVHDGKYIVRPALRIETTS